MFSVSVVQGDCIIVQTIAEVITIVKDKKETNLEQFCVCKKLNDVVG